VAVCFSTALSVVTLVTHALKIAPFKLVTAVTNADDVIDNFSD
jgi:hypothetical protein